ncbi:MAG: TonB-dependent receptor [Alphaproteobacteria bacterium]|nr:TonB-dependent receptor [Alphaproteobacteria bacterium]
MSSSRAAVYAACASLAAIAQANAQNEAQPTPPVNLPPITVTAGRGSDLEKLDVSTTVLTRKQVEAMPETGVDQIVNRIPGIFTYTVPTGQLHPTGQPVSIRGFGTSTTINTLVMMDGVPINDPYFQTVDWSRISKNSIERVEVIRGGGATTLWGNMATGGVINIVTKQPTVTGVQGDLSYGSYNTTNANVGGTAIVNDKLKVGLAYNHAQSSGYNLTPSQYQNANLVPTASKADNVDFSTYLNPTDQLRLFAKAYFHQAYEDGLVWNIAHNNWSAYRMLMGGTYDLNEKSSISASFWAGGGSFGTINVANGSYTLNNVSATNQFVSQIEQAPNTDQGGAVFYSAEFGPVKDIKIGVDARRLVIYDTNNLFASVSSAPTTFITNGEHRLEGVFGQATWQLAPVPADLTVGLREDFYQALNANVLTVNSGTTLNVPNSSAASFDPRVGLKFYMTDAFTLRGAIYRNFSAPGMNQMYRSFASGTSFTATNPTLQPMINFGQEVGFDVNWKKVNLAFTFFNNTLDNFIDFVTICNANAACAAPFISAAGLSPAFTTVSQYNNVGTALFQGFEIIGTVQPFEQLKLTGGFTNTNAYLINSYFPTLERVGVQLGQVPVWTVTATAEWRPLPELAFTATLRSFPAYWNDTGHTQLNDAATLLDLGASWSPAKAVDVYASIQNATNVGYLAQGYRLTSFEGQTVNPGSIPSLGMPLTAIAGVRVRF